MILLTFILFFSGQPDRIEKDIVQLQEHIQLLDGELNRLQRQKHTDYRRQKELMERIPGMEIERAKLIQEKKKASLQLELIAIQKKKNQNETIQVKEKIGNLEIILGERLRSMYKKGPLGYSQALLKENEIEDMVMALYYIEHVSKKDQTLLRQFLDAKLSLKTAEDALLQLESMETERRDELDSKNRELGQLLARRKKEISVLFKKSKERESMLNQLNREKQELSELIEKLQRGDVEEGALPHIPITHYKGRLNWPATGTILRGFGVYRDAQFSTKRKQNGIDIGVARGDEVKAVYDGKIIYADWFKSYGNLIIIDHGRQYVSFYAHNDTLLVKKGDVVERNQVVARAGDSGSLEGPFLHFEIRKSTQAEDPIKWLKKRRRR